MPFQKGNKLGSFARTPEQIEQLKKIGYKKGRKVPPNEVEKRRQSQLGVKRPPNFGKHISEIQTGKSRPEETKKRISQSRKAMLDKLPPEKRRAMSASYGMKGKKHSSETIEKLRQSAIRRQFWLTAIEKQSETVPEQTVRQYLESRNIRFLYQEPVGHVVIDFVLPDYTVALEVQGCYWHGCLQCGFADKNKRRQAQDKRKYGILVNAGYQVLYIWEHELKDTHRLAQLIFSLT